MMATKSSVPEYNILLLGETGSGKSTFINSIANYVTFHTLEEASKGEPVILIPTKFMVSDENYRHQEIYEGNDDNENMESARSGTIACKSYVFEFPHHKLRFIDSAGAGATQGLEMDRINIEDVLTFISNYDNLHAIALVINSNQPKFTDRFEYCLQCLLTNLNKSAAANIVFLFSFSEGTGYKPGHVMQPLTLLLDNLKRSKSSVEIKLRKDIMYCLDNKAFQCLVANKRGLKFDKEDMDSYTRAWDKTQLEFYRLLHYIVGDGSKTGLKPHKVKNTLGINEARKFIKIIKPLIQEILKINEANSARLTNISNEIKEYTGDIDNCSTCLTIKQMEIEIVELEKPQTICKSDKCVKYIGNEGKDIKEVYNNLCCPGCPIGSSYKRLLCKAINVFSGICRSCGCHISQHDVVNYLQIIIEKEIANASAIETIQNATSKKDQLEKTVEDIAKQQKQLDDEIATTKTALLIFGKYLEANAMTQSTCDVVDELVTPLSSLGQLADDVWPISTEEIFDLKKQLFQMKINGSKIESVYKIEIRALERAASAADVITSVKSGLSERWQRLSNTVQSLAMSIDASRMAEAFNPL